jgi:hypothetical protein
MGCCGSDDKPEVLEFRYGSKRSCTDILIFLLFIASFVGSFLILNYSIDNGGDPMRVIYAVDYQGRVCGRASGLEDFKYGAWPVLPPASDPMLADEIFDIKICVNDCTATQTDSTNFPTQYDSWKVFRYCIPKANVENNAVTRLMGRASETAGRVFGDLLITWPVILVAAFVALIFSFIYVKCMKVECCRMLLVWGTIFLVILGGFLVGWGLLRYASYTEEGEVEIPNRARAARIVGWITVGLTALFIIVVFFLRKRIALSLHVIGAAACALDQMKTLILYPIFPFIFVCGWMVYWITTALFLFSVKTSEVRPLPSGVGYDQVAYMAGSTTYNEYSWDDTFQKLFAYHFLHLLWVFQFVIYATFLVMAGAIANWYFSRPSPTDETQREEGEGEGQLPASPVLNSFGRAIRYHVGTVAFGALIIAIIMFIRAIVTYIQKKTRNAQNPCTRCLLCCVQCCLKCCQKCIDYISRNALAWCAIKGDNFCTSAFHAFGLLMQNVGRAAAMSLVGTFVIFFGKICVALVTTGIAALVIMYVWEDRISSTVMPVVVIFILTFVVAALFMEVFETGLETMFLCFIADTERKWAPSKLASAFAAAENELKIREAKAAAKAAKMGGAAPGAPAGMAVEGQPADPYANTRQ